MQIFWCHVKHIYSFKNIQYEIYKLLKGDKTEIQVHNVLRMILSTYKEKTVSESAMFSHIIIHMDSEMCLFPLEVIALNAVDR